VASSIPLIRASAIIGLESWLLECGRPAPEILSGAGLPASPRAAPARLASFHAFFALLAGLAEAEGPDFGARIATPEALMMLGAPAQAVRSSRTTREALHKVSRSFHQHVSQVFFLVENGPGGVEVACSIPVEATPEMQHQAHQHIACLVRTIGEAAGLGMLPAEIRMVGHPKHGVAHLIPYLGGGLAAHDARQLWIRIPDCAADAPFGWAEAHSGFREEALGGVARATLSESARVLIAGMIEDGNPNMNRLALCAGRSRRTLQRLLAAEGTSFAALLDSVRQENALAQLNDSRESVSSIAQDVGFRSVSSLSRAVRRWTKASPREIRKDRRPV
jgi:AraC-like DNA-binding protein